MGEDGLATVAEYSPEVAYCAIWIFFAIEDVPPSELTTIVLRVELHSITDAQGLGNQAREHVGNEDDGIFPRSVQVIRVELILEALAGVTKIIRNLDEWVHTNERIVRDRVARSKRINQVMEVAVAALHTKRSKQFANPIAPAEVLTDIRVSANQGITGFGRHNRQEHRGSVHPIVGIGTCSVAEKIHIHPIKDGLGQLSSTSGSGGRRQEAVGADRGRTSRVTSNTTDRIIEPRGGRCVGGCG